MALGGGGGRRESSRIGGSITCDGRGQKDFRVGEIATGMATSSKDGLRNCWRSEGENARPVGLIGGVISPLGGAMMMVRWQRSHMPEAYVIACLQVLQVDTVVDGVAACPLLNLKSKLDLVVVGSAAFESSPPISDAEDRCGWGGDVLEAQSLFLAFSIALFSYSSHNLAVFAGVHGGGRGSLNGDDVLARGEE